MTRRRSRSCIRTGFDWESFDDFWAQAQAAYTLDLGPTLNAEQKKRLVRQLLPDLDGALVDRINQELDAQPAPESLPTDRLWRRVQPSLTKSSAA